MTIVDLDAFRKKKQEAAPLVHKEPAGSSSKIISASVNEASNLDLFTREAMRFRFQNMVPPGAFATVHTEKLPPPFPPDDLPPLVA